MSRRIHVSGPLLRVALVLVALAVAAKPGPAPTFEPDPQTETALTLEGSTWTAASGPFKIWIKELDRDERLNFIKRVTGHGIDPFAGRLDAPAAYHTFLLVIENLEGGALTFNPQNCWLHTNREEVLLPQGMAELSFKYRVSGRELPVAYEQVQGALLERALTVAPGQRISGLLVYDRVRPKTRRWLLSLRVTLPDGELAAFELPYRRVGLQDKKSKKKEAHG